MRNKRVHQKLQLARNRRSFAPVEILGENHRDLGVREALEAVYSREPSDLDPMLEDLQAEALREIW